MTENIEAIKNSILTLLEEEEFSIVHEVLNDYHPADIAEIFKALTLQEQVQLFDHLTHENAGELLNTLDTTSKNNLIDTLDKEKLTKILDIMSTDDTVDILGDFSDEKVEEVITQLSDTDTLRELLSYDENTAGGIMTSEFIKIHQSMTMEQILSYIRSRIEAEKITFYYIYVVDDNEKFVGILSLRLLITTPPYITAEQIMETSIITVKYYEDQEEVAQKLQKYDVLAIPVVDDFGHIRGIVTWDDAQDIKEEEVTEDIYTSSGIHTTEDTDHELLISGPIRHEVKARLPWLVLTMGTSSLAVLVIDLFKYTIDKHPIYAIFIPLLTGLGGNIAIQSLTLMVRSLYIGHITTTKIKNILFRETLVGLLIGGAIGFIALAATMAWKQDIHLALLVGSSMVIIMVLAAFTGTLMPMILKIAGFDPAVACGPFITSAMDVVGLTIYLSIATALLLYIT